MADFDKTEVADGSLDTKRTLGDLVEPTTPDEEQTKKERVLTVLVNDPEWTKAYDESRVNGPIVREIEQVFLSPTVFSNLK